MTRNEHTRAVDEPLREAWACLDVVLRHYGDTITDLFVLQQLCLAHRAVERALEELPRVGEP